MLSTTQQGASTDSPGPAVAATVSGGGAAAGLRAPKTKTSDRTPFANLLLRHPERQARKRHINIIFFVRLVLGRPQVCPGDFTGFVPGTNPVKTWDKPGFSPCSTQWKPDFTVFVPGTNPVCPRDNRWGRRAAQKVYVKNVYVPFSLARVGVTV